MLKIRSGTGDRGPPADGLFGRIARAIPMSSWVVRPPAIAR
jgi:hypothetical protein